MTVTAAIETLVLAISVACFGRFLSGLADFILVFKPSHERK